MLTSGGRMRADSSWSDGTLRALCAGAFVLCGSPGCNNSVDLSPKPGLITMEGLKTQRVTMDPSLFFVDFTLANKTSHVVGNFYSAAFSAPASAEFDIDPAMSTIVGCVAPDPWDVPPGGTKA